MRLHSSNKLTYLHTVDYRHISFLLQIPVSFCLSRLTLTSFWKLNYVSETVWHTFTFNNRKNLRILNICRNHTILPMKLFSWASLSVKLHFQSSRFRLKNNRKYFRRLYGTGVYCAFTAVPHTSHRSMYVIMALQNWNKYFGASIYFHSRPAEWHKNAFIAITFMLMTSVYSTVYRYRLYVLVR